jgi:ligand-binding sensor domain-containing protein
MQIRALALIPMGTARRVSGPITTFRMLKRDARFLKNSSLAILAWVALFWPNAQAQIAEKKQNGDIKQFKITHWTTDAGLPTNTLIHLNQDSEGYLWIGSYDGLIRFDGRNFINYSKESTPDLRSFHARTFEEDSKGNLWIGTGYGLVVHNKGKFTDLTSNTFNFFIESLWLDEEAEKIWIGTRDSGLFVYHIATNTYEPITNNFSKDLINDIVPDADGGIWVGSEKTGLGYLKKGEWTYFGKSDGLMNTEINCLYMDDGGTLHIGTTSGIYLKNKEGFTELERFSGIRINKIKVDFDGRLWVATSDGAFKRRHDGRWEQYTKERGLSNNDIRDMHFDAGQNAWLATYRGGLNQLRETSFTTYSFNEGLDAEATGAFFELGPNHFLTASTDGKLFEIKNGKTRQISLKTPINQRIYWIHRDHLNNLWIASYQGLLLITPEGKEKLFTEQEGLPTNQVRIITQDAQKRYWIGTRISGLVRMNLPTGSVLNPTFEQFKYKELLQLNSTFIMGIEEDGIGNLLVSSNTGGLNLLSPDGQITNLTRSYNLKTNITYNARRDRQGATWIATSDGLIRLANGTSHTFTHADGIPHESIFDVLEDNLGQLWMPSARGIIRVSKQQLEEYIAGTLINIEWKVFDKNNELRKSECTGASNMFKDSQGHLWFLMLDGIVSVNPASITVNTRLPEVFIEKLIVDDQSLEVTEKTQLEAGTQRILIHYMGVNLDYPGTTRYRYKLANFDKEWIEAGTDIQAVYTNLGYGTYTFQVIASNNDGIWNEKGAQLTFTIAPHFYETWYFSFGMVLLSVLILYAYVRWRINDINHRAKVLEQMVDDRTRMISEQRDELIALNEELTASQDQILDQRDSLARKNEEIAAINTNLEKLVAERTHVLEQQNLKLSEYAFINAHEIRGPLASILGLIHLFELTNDPKEQNELLTHLKKSSVELDKIVRATNRMLEGMERPLPPKKLTPPPSDLDKV